MTPRTITTVGGRRRAGEVLGPLRADRRRGVGRGRGRRRRAPRHARAAHHRVDGPARAAHARARSPGHGAGPALRPDRGRGREPGARRAARPTWSAGATSTPTGCASGPASRAPTSTATSSSRSPSRPRSRRSCRSPARIGLAREVARPRRDPRGTRRGARPTTTRCALGEALRDAAAAAPPSASPPARGGADGDPAGLARGPADARRPAPARTARARSATPPASGWPGCCSAATAPRSSRSSSVRRSDRCSTTTRERDTRLAETLEAWFDAGGGLRETAERLHIHPNTVTQRLDRVGQLLGEGWREPGPASSTCSSRCRWCGSARGSVMTRHMILWQIMAAHTWLAREPVSS